MREQKSPSTGRVYPFRLICGAYRVARSSGYSAGQMTAGSSVRRRGPRPVVTDLELLEAIRRVLAASPFLTEGHRKVHARLRRLGVRCGRRRILRVMREHELLAPHRIRHRHGDPSHSGSIVTEKPNLMWGSDGTKFCTSREGWCWLFFAIDHFDDYIVGHHAAKIGDRFAALEPVQQGIRSVFGSCAEGVADGLALRVDWGTQYTSDRFRGEVRFLGGQISHSFVGEPQCNGISERFVRTLKEECLWLHDFESLEQARPVIAAFIELYNREWLIERLGYRTPAQARLDALAEAA